MTLGDRERKARKLDRKTVLRKGAPVFSALVEVLAFNKFRIHRWVAWHRCRMSDFSDPAMTAPAAPQRILVFDGHLSQAWCFSQLI